MTQVRCRVQGVFVAVSGGGASPAVLLSVNGEKSLPIYIGLWEAISINNALNKEVSPRPLTHDLIIDLFRSFGIMMRALQIDALEDGVYYANMVLLNGDREESMDCRPSDGIAIALRCGAEIFIEDQVFSDGSVEKDDLPEMVELNSYLFT
jgi:bifunctional DNase/RNase